MENLSSRITASMVRGIFGERLIDNNFRGPWTEYMVAEALGEECEVVSHAWHAWDLQIGDTQSAFPDRIRIQVKNTARLQTWHRPGGKLTDCQWKLELRPKPNYFDAYNPGAPCEDYGYLCDLFVLCHHPLEDFDTADHRNPHQWNFYLVPVTENHDVFPLKRRQAKNCSYTVVPDSLRKGIRRRPPIEPLTFNELTPSAIRESLRI